MTKLPSHSSNEKQMCRLGTLTDACIWHNFDTRYNYKPPTTTIKHWQKTFPMYRDLQGTISRRKLCPAQMGGHFEKQNVDSSGMNILSAPAADISRIKSPHLFSQKFPMIHIAWSGCYALGPYSPQNSHP
jgi:hypothetical protein